MYDEAFPGNSLINDQFDGYLVQTEDLTIDVQEAVIPAVPKTGPIDPKPTIISRLRTAMPERRVQCERENIIAAAKRNWDTPDVSEVINYEEIIPVAVKRFFDCFTVPELIDDSPLCTFGNCVEWFDKQIPSTRGKILKDITFVDEQNLSEYNFMIKCDVKPKLDISPQSEYSALQTVVYHGKEKNWVWGPIFNELTTRLLQCLRPNVIINTKLNSEEMESRFKFLNPESNLTWYEMDLSKYDKSQGYLHQQVEMEIWERLGLDKALRDLWERGHVSTSFQDFKTGFKSWVLYQRKSGDVTTFIGNTIVNMVAMSDSLPLEQACAMAFGGDDSLVAFPSDVDLTAYDPCQRVSSVWNFQCKLFLFDYPSFCGKVLLRDGLGWILLPDPLKLITKLGKTKARNVKELEEVRISYADNYKGLNDYRAIMLLQDYLVDRYKIKSDSSIALCSLVKFLSSSSAFQQLFFCENYSSDVRNIRLLEWS